MKLWSYSESVTSKVHKPVQNDQTSMSKLIATISDMKLFLWVIKLSISSIFQHGTMMH